MAAAVVAAAVAATAAAGSPTAAVSKTTPQPPPLGGGFSSSVTAPDVPRRRPDRCSHRGAVRAPPALPTFYGRRDQLKTRWSPGVATARFSAARRMPLIIPRKTMPWKGNTEYQ